MLKIFIAVIAVIIILILLLKKYLKRNNLFLRWDRIIVLLIIAHLIYSFIGIIVSPYYVKPNGNICKGWSFGINICGGDINAE